MKDIIDITSQKQVTYSFANEEATIIDRRLAKRILRKVYMHLSEFLTVESLPSTVTFINKNKKSCRIIVYDFKKLLSQDNVFVVVFYANKRKNLAEDFTKSFFNTDWEIAMSMIGDNNILCYASQELSDGNWFNIVLFTKESAKKDVIVTQKHKYAAHTLAPKRFSWIRLHNAILPDGIISYKNIEFTKTKYYNFETMWFARRNYGKGMTI